MSSREISRSNYPVAPNSVREDSETLYQVVMLPGSNPKPKTELQWLAAGRESLAFRVSGIIFGFQDFEASAYVSGELGERRNTKAID